MGEFLTGDEQMDSVIPVLMEMVAAVREDDAVQYGRLSAQADLAVAEMGIQREFIGWFMFTIAASMIPYHKSPDELLRWYAHGQKRMPVLLAEGYDRASAATIIDREAREEGEG